MAKVGFEAVAVAPSDLSYIKPPAAKPDVSRASRPRTAGWHGSTHKFTEHMVNRFYHDNSLYKSQRSRRSSVHNLAEKLEASKERREQIHEALVRKKSRKKQIKELLKQGKRMLAKLEVAAVTIQRYVRGFLARVALKDHIATRVRGRLERQLEDLEEQVEDYWFNLNDRADKAATAIQRYFRWKLLEQQNRVIRAARRNKALEIKATAATSIQREARVFIQRTRERREREQKEFEDKVEALRQKHVWAMVKDLWYRKKLNWKTIRNKYARELKPQPPEIRPSSKEVFKRTGGGFVRQTSRSDVKTEDPQPLSAAKPFMAARPPTSETKSRSPSLDPIVRSAARPSSAKSWCGPGRETPSYMTPTIGYLQKLGEEAIEVKKKPPRILRRKSLTRNTISRELKVRTSQRKLSEDNKGKWKTSSNSPLHSMIQALPPRPTQMVPRIPNKFKDQENPEEESNTQLAIEPETPMESVSYYRPVDVVSADLKTALADKFSMPLDYWLSFAKKRPQAED